MSRAPARARPGMIVTVMITMITMITITGMIIIIITIIMAKTTMAIITIPIRMPITR
jgi:hypothetical protein